MKKLPKTPSKLLAIALADLVKIEKSKKFEVDMTKWVYPGNDENKCLVCLAGAVMVKSLDADTSQYLVPFDFAEENKLNAINALRAGRVDVACNLLQVKNKYGSSVYITPYELSPKEFKTDIRSLIKDLQKVRM